MDKTTEELIKLYNEDSLKERTAEIIEIYKANDIDKLHSLALKLDLHPEEYHDCSGKLFKKMMMSFHPDKITFFHNQIKKHYKEGNVEELNRMKQNIRPIKIGNVLSSTSDYSHSAQSSSENYEYYKSESYDESFYGDDYADEESDIDKVPGEEFGFIEAIKKLMYGKMFSEFSPKDLMYLDGTIDLAQQGIEDLNGIEYCQNITGINLERNNICHLGDLEELTHLTNLYLAHNQISDLSPLSHLQGLHILDLSFNDIEDIDDLLSLDELEYLNLMGNNIPDSDELRKLKDRCFVII